MCGSIPPTPLTAPLPTSGGGAAATTAATTTTATTPATDATATTAGGPATKTDGPVSKDPVQGGGAAEGAANLELQKTLSALVQAVTALAELLKGMQTGVAGANGGGPAQKDPEQLPTQVPTKGGGPAQKDEQPDAKGGGSCATPPPAPLQGGGGSMAAPAENHASAGHSH